jgi:hypothetical protein
LLRLGQLFAELHPHLHAVIGWSSSSLGHHPVYILTGILDIARFTVDAILGVDLQALARTVFKRMELVHT